MDFFIMYFNDISIHITYEGEIYIFGNDDQTLTVDDLELALSSYKETRKEFE